MPPNIDAKLSADKSRFPDWAATLGRCLGVLKGHDLEVARERIGDLTNLETKLLVRELEKKKEPKDILPIIETSWKNCTLEKPTGSRISPAEAGPASIGGETQQAQPPEKWRDACNREAAEIRLPSVY